jgi:hypothetical protein
MITKEALREFGQNLQSQHGVERNVVPSLTDILGLEPGLPDTQRYVLGVSQQDGAFVGFDLTEQGTKSFLVIGSDGSGKNEIARRVIWQAGIKYQQSREYGKIQVVILTSRPWKWTGLPSDIVRFDDISEGNMTLLQECLAQPMRYTPDGKPFRPGMLVIDSLTLAGNIWNRENGAQYRDTLATLQRAGYMVMASMNADRLVQDYDMFDPWVSLFSTKIFGRTGQTELAGHLGCPQPETLQDFVPSVQFRLTVDGEACDLWVPQEG